MGVSIPGGCFSLFPSRVLYLTSVADDVGTWGRANVIHLTAVIQRHSTRCGSVDLNGITNCEAHTRKEMG